jgi:arylsulfatase A-like enzyme|tara:strand:- start:1823 stop:3430 length:1608 start_codon:yes stop_codon:yes gene_type:complete
MRFIIVLLSTLILFTCTEGQPTNSVTNINNAQEPAESASITALENRLSLDSRPNAAPKNIVFILSDDHRFDFMGFTGKVPWLETPNLDRLASEGAYFPNAYVTTALCSPSRASILTGLYSHTHTVVDNAAPDPGNLIFFPEYMQNAGYQTSFFGKWHMGNHSDDPQPGFDHWESFRGQGVYYGPTLNINGKHTTYDDSTYITDLLTDHAIGWLKQRDEEQPFFLYLSHKAVHSEFQPAARHLGQYQEEPITYPPSYNTPNYGKPELPSKNAQGEPLRGQDYYGDRRIPDWVKQQRESWHGVDYMYHGRIPFKDFFYRYTETLMGIDDSVGEVLSYLDENGLAEDTLVVYMGDNGFSFGEHGLIDKRHFYEESAKVPLLVRWPSQLDGGRPINQLVQNIDLAPTFLAAAGLTPPDYFHGSSLMPLLSRQETTWRDRIFYEYYWEQDFPQTPTMFGVRTDRYKYIRYHGIWDTNEFYDLENDPNEMQNLIAAPEHQERIASFATEIYDWLETTDGMNIPLKNIVRPKFGDHRNQAIH